MLGIWIGILIHSILRQEEGNKSFIDDAQNVSKPQSTSWGKSARVCVWRVGVDSVHYELTLPPDNSWKQLVKCSILYQKFERKNWTKNVQTSLFHIYHSAGDKPLCGVCTVQYTSHVRPILHCTLCIVHSTHLLILTQDWQVFITKAKSCVTGSARIMYRTKHTHTHTFRYTHTHTHKHTQTHTQAHTHTHTHTHTHWAQHKANFVVTVSIHVSFEPADHKFMTSSSGVVTHSQVSWTQCVRPTLSVVEGGGVIVYLGARKGGRSVSISSTFNNCIYIYIYLCPGCLRGRSTT